MTMLLGRLDVVVYFRHSELRMDATAMTRTSSSRGINYVDVLGHVTRGGFITGGADAPA